MFSAGAFSPGGVRQNRLRRFLRGAFDGLELPVDKPSHRALSVRLGSHQQTRRPGGGFVMGIGSGLQVFNHPPPAGRSIHRPKAVGERFDGTRPAQGQHVISAQQGFKRPPDFGPGVQQQRIRNFDGLTHGEKVAKRYHLSSGLYYNGQEGYLETFRPYALPGKDWIEEVAKALKRVAE
jgi:hypothetical protein